MSALQLSSRLQGRLLRPRLRAILLLVVGMLTDGGIHYDEDGRVVKRFDVRDGLAVRMLQRAGIVVVLISGGRSGAIEKLARHLDIAHCRTGLGDKPAGQEQLHRELDMAREHTVFLGDDLNELAVGPVTGLLVAPAGAAQGLRRQGRHVELRRHGADGALRELTEAL